MQCDFYPLPLATFRSDTAVPGEGSSNQNRDADLSGTLLFLHNAWLNAIPNAFLSVSFKQKKVQRKL